MSVRPRQPRVVSQSVLPNALSLEQETGRFFFARRLPHEVPQLWKRDGSWLADSRWQAGFMDNGTAKFYGDSRQPGRFAATCRNAHKEKSDCGIPLPGLPNHHCKILPSIYKGQHACQRLKLTLAASSALVGASPPASSSLPAPIFSRWQVLRSFSGTDLVAGKAFEAAGLSPGNENNTVSRRRCPEKPYCPLYIEGK